MLELKFRQNDTFYKGPFKTSITVSESKLRETLGDPFPDIDMLGWCLRSKTGAILTLWKDPKSPGNKPRFSVYYNDAFGKKGAGLQFFKQVRSALENRDKSQFYSFMSKDDCYDPIMSLKQAQQMQDEFTRNLAVDDQSKDIMYAARLMLSGKYDACIREYESLMEEYPDEKAECLSQIGAAHYFLGNFKVAILFYLRALDAGATDDMMDDNIWEACLAHYEKHNDLSQIEHYIRCFPEGAYIELAREYADKKKEGSG